METTTDLKSTITLFGSVILSYKTLFFDIDIIISYAFLQMMNKSLYAALIKICTLEVTAVHGCLECGLSSMLLSSLLKQMTQCLTVLTSHCLSSTNTQKVLMNVSGCHLFHMEELSGTPLLHMHFHVRCHSVSLPLCFQLPHSNKM